MDRNDPGIEHRLAILQVIAIYSRRFDDADAAGWADIFTPDGRWESHREGGPEGPIRVALAEGREQIRAWAEKRHSERGHGVRVRHHQSTTSFEELGDGHAVTTTLVIITRQKPTEGPELFLAGTYYDRWRLTPEGWRIEHRKLVS